MCSDTGSTARLYGSSTQGTGPIILYNMQCTGEERRLLECPGSALDVNSCSHAEDAGVTCLPGEKKAAYTIVIWKSFHYP